MAYPELLAQGPQRSLVLGSEILVGTGVMVPCSLSGTFLRRRSLRALAAGPEAQGWGERRWCAQFLLQCSRLGFR